MAIMTHTVIVEISSVAQDGVIACMRQCIVILNQRALPRVVIIQPIYLIDVLVQLNLVWLHRTHPRARDNLIHDLGLKKLPHLMHYDSIVALGSAFHVVPWFLLLSVLVVNLTLRLVSRLIMIRIHL